MSPALSAEIPKVLKDLLFPHFLRVESSGEVSTDHGDQTAGLRLTEGDPQDVVLDGMEGCRQFPQEVFQPGGQAGRVPPFIVIMVRVDGERVVVGGKIAGVLLFQREEAVQTVAVPLKEKGRQESRGPAIAIVIRVDGDELVMGEAGDQGRRQPLLLGLLNPGDEAGHQGWNVTGLGRQVDQGPRLGIPDRILAVAVAAGTCPAFHQGVDALDQLLGRLGPSRRPLLDAQQGLPVASDFAHVPFAAVERDFPAGEDLLGLGEGQPVPFDPGGVVGGTEPRPVPHLGLDGRRQRDLLDDRSRRLDLHQAAGHRRRQRVTRLPGSRGAVFHRLYFVTPAPGGLSCQPGEIFAMYTIYKLRADELDQRFLDTLKHQFQDREIEIVVSEAAEREEDETAYLLRSPANRERLLRALENVAEGRNLEVVDLGDLA